MTAMHLAEEILREIDAGRLDADAVVVRPFCMCDQDVGYVEAQFLDQVIRRWEPADVEPEGRVYKHGSAAPGDNATATLKLG